MPESQALISFRDRSFKYGEGAFDTTRTFGHRIFKLKEYIDRFYRTFRFMQLDPGLSPSKLMEITEEVLERNLPHLGKDEDYWVTQRISQGVDHPDGDIAQPTRPFVIVECTPLPLKARAHLFRDGLEVITPAIRRVPPESFSPRVITHNYLNLLVADQEARRHNPKA